MTSSGTPAASPIDASGVRIGVCASRFNLELTTQLVDGAVAACKDSGAIVDGPHWVAGAFELPIVSMALAASGCAAVVALGCVIRGETAHFDIVANESARGLMQVTLDTGVPIGNGIIAVEDFDQALARVAPGDNKGAEAAHAALQAYATLRDIASGTLR